MLPSMQPMIPSRTKRARATKAFEQVRIGPVRLYFSHWELIGLQVDGSPPVVCGLETRPGVTTPGHAEQHRRGLEPDESRWVARQEFERRWQEVGAVFPGHGRA
jgi:hypothetical protein